MFSIMGNRGWHITFENGVTVSVHIGGGTYSDNHDHLTLIGHEHEQRLLGSTTADVAAWDAPAQRDAEGRLSNNFITREFDNGDGDVLGRQTPRQVLAFLNWAAQKEAKA